MTQPAEPPRRPWPLTALAILALRDVPFWGRSWLRRALRVPVALGYAIVLLTLLLLPFENRLAFPGARASLPWTPPRPEFGVRELSLPSAQGDVIHAWFTTPPGWKPEDGAVLYSHGNGDNLSGWQGVMMSYREQTGRAVMLYDYPGFGKSTGRPTEQGGYAAIDAAHDWLTGEAKVPAGEVVLVGSSMGGAFATDLASRRPCRALVLVATFTSFPDVAQYHYPFLPARWLVSNQMRSEAKLSSVTAPVFVAHGRDDHVVPFAMGERLYRAANEPKHFYPVDGLGHGDPMTPDFFATLRAFLSQTKP